MKQFKALELNFVSKGLRLCVPIDTLSQEYTVAMNSLGDSNDMFKIGFRSSYKAILVSFKRIHTSMTFHAKTGKRPYIVSRIGLK